MPIITTYRALSGSQYVYYTSEETPPVGITNIVVVFEFNSITEVTGAISSNVLWEWNKVDTSQFQNHRVIQDFDGNSAGSGSLAVSTSSIDASIPALNVNYDALNGSIVFPIDFNLSDQDQYAFEILALGTEGSAPDGVLMFALLEEAGGTVDAIAMHKSSGFSNVDAYLWNDDDWITNQALPTATALNTMANTYGGFIMRAMVHKKPDANNKFLVKMQGVRLDGGTSGIETITSASIGGTWDFSGSNFSRVGVGIYNNTGPDTGTWQIQEMRILSVSSSLDTFFAGNA